MVTVLLQELSPSQTTFTRLEDCIHAVEEYNNQASRLMASSLRAGEAVCDIFKAKRWEERNLSGFEALCKELKWTRSNCYQLKHGWEMYVEFREVVPPGIQVAGAYAWAQLYKVPPERRRVVLGEAIRLAEADNGEVTAPLIQKVDKQGIDAPQLKLLSCIPDMEQRQKAHELALRNASRRGSSTVNNSDCLEAIEELSSTVTHNEGEFSDPSHSYDTNENSRGDCAERTAPRRDRPTSKQLGSRKPTGKNYDELLATTQKILAVNEDLKQQIQDMRGDMNKMRDRYEQRIALMQEQLEKLTQENQRLKATT